jgi:hypothetical protein
MREPELRNSLTAEDAEIRRHAEDCVKESPF